MTLFRDRVTTIVGTAARRLRGERRLPFFVIGLPIVVMLFVGTIFGVGGKKLAVGVVAPEDPHAQALVGAFDRSDRIDPKHFDRAESARRSVRRGRLSGAVIIPADYADALRRGDNPEIQVVVQPGRTESADARAAVGAVLARANLDVRAARALQAAKPQPYDDALRQVRKVTAAVPDFSTRDARPESPFSYTAPSNLVLFAFITALVTAAGIVQSRQLGVTRRVLASPTPASAIVVAELLAAFMTALFQSTLMLAAGAVFFGVRFGPLIAVAPLIAAIALVSAAAGSLLATFVRTPEQAINFGPPIGIAFGMLGGCMWPLEGVGPVVQVIGHVVPHGWAMDAFVRLIFDHKGLAGIAGHVAILFGYAAVLLLFATARLRRSVLTA